MQNVSFPRPIVIEGLKLKLKSPVCLREISWIHIIPKGIFGSAKLHLDIWIQST